MNCRASRPWEVPSEVQLLPVWALYGGSLPFAFQTVPSGLRTSFS